MATDPIRHRSAQAAPPARRAAWAGFFAWGFYFEALGAGEPPAD